LSFAQLSFKILHHLEHGFVQKVSPQLNIWLWLVVVVVELVTELLHLMLVEVAAAQVDLEQELHIQ
jgi:hypothetical protein